ncbi:hypothetical protein [Kitasatospora aureofaciens]|uniref:hypothetical protein n=1 Tax=Kitasatospora aureofaciens TaxID=1894 RepID=UPI0027E1FE59|nr:hypothetical protein [Kitasatospora aureofaciens]
MEALCEQLGDQRGRPIRLVPYPLPTPGPFGVWIATESADYILYQQETSKAHQNHIILHEVGHIMADHQGVDVDDSFLQAMTGNCPGVVTRALRRTSYDEEHERQAELVATIILEWASVLDRVTPRRASDPSVQRVQTALGDRRGWL